MNKSDKPSNQHNIHSLALKCSVTQSSPPIIWNQFTIPVGIVTEL